VRCKIVAILSVHYKVELLEGTEKGHCHRYLFDLVKAATGASQVTGDAAAPGQAASEGEPATTAASVAEPPLGGEPGKTSIMSLFDEF
jgi:hypothetical protein